MRGDYTLYSRVKEKLDKIGILAKIEKLRNDHDMPYIGAVFQDDVLAHIKDIKEEGFFRHLPNREKVRFQERIIGVYKKIEENPWKVERFAGTIEEETDWEDLLLFTGWWASNVLGPKNLWKYKESGFSNLTDFVGSIGAAMQEDWLDDKRGYKWIRKLPNGQILENEITGDINCDLRVFQVDKTPYKTFDPVGNEVSYRPEFLSDKQGIWGYHSTEPALFASILRWIEQCRIPNESLEDKARKTIEWAKTLGQGGGSCAEHFGGFELNTRMNFVCWDYPLPVLDANNSTTQPVDRGVYTDGETAYFAYVNQENELVFSREKDPRASPKKEIRARFVPDDADHLIHGLIYQSAVGIGRTPAKALIDMLEYYFSEQFQFDMKEAKKLRK